ncbi:hypothetical protein [Thermosulfurimonas dismutans]|uniref:Uncharacterized protein n=1 Tax=Thermosulfurimonas dismutans TaxID=999894 RepID=A0A179D4Y3_9BACT|nr:hypothetical protein [Thermosulfurimonas dismutans]OAQ20668.1 hypothetical protein TDIS_1283 [Thermosulfurimonas dismutans]
MKRRNPLWNLVFIVILIMAFLWARYSKERGHRVLLAEFTMTSPSKQSIGRVSFFSKDHQDKIIQIQLSERLKEEVYVILYYREGIGWMAGKLSGTVFVRSLGPSFTLEKVSSVILRGVKSGLVYGEAVINSSQKG